MFPRSVLCRLLAVLGLAAALSAAPVQAMAPGADGPSSGPAQGASMGGERLLERLMLAQSPRSCSPRRTCGEHFSCEDARWSLENCSWGGRLDGDSDGIPCESLC